MRLLRRLLRWENLVPLLTIALGVAAATGITSGFLATEQVLIALVTMVAAHLLVERLGILSSIEQKVSGIGDDYSIALLPRTSPEFQRFSDFVAGASDVLVIGVDLGFLAQADAWFVQEAVQAGMDLKLLLIDPETSGHLESAINAQDERNARPNEPAHEHVATAARTVSNLKTLVGPAAKGRLEIRARCDIPSPGMTMVDPGKRHGKIRVELKLYKRNHGEVPYFILRRSSVWYQMFYEHYFEKLWNDSALLYTSGEQAGEREPEH